jgi:hypothetical protein
VKSSAATAGPVPDGVVIRRLFSLVVVLEGATAVMLVGDTTVKLVAAIEAKVTVVPRQNWSR